MVTQVPYEELTSVEQSLVEHVGRGEWLDLAAGDQAVDEAAMRSWGESRRCRASVIRDILRGRLAVDIDPHGVRLRGARIIGQLDLENLITDVWLELEDCLLEEGVVARDARLPGLWLTRCQIEHPAEPPFDGSALSCGMLGLTGARIIGHTDAGAVELLAAHVSSRLDCTEMKLCNDSGPALDANSLQVGQNMRLSGEFTGIGAGGAVCLLGAQIGGHLLFDGAQLRNDSGPALLAESLLVGQHLFLRWFTATGGGQGAAVNLKGAQVGGAFQFAPERLEHKDDSRRRLAADGLTYAGVPGRISPEDWRELLREGTPEYAAQPYQQLAAGCRALGDDRQARQTLIAQRDDQPRSCSHTLGGAVVGPDHQGHPRLWLPTLAGAVVPRRGGGAVVRFGGGAWLARCAGAIQPDGYPGPVLHIGSAGQRRIGSQLASGHQRGQVGLRPDQVFVQCDCGLVVHCRLDFAAAGVGVRSIVHSRLHQRGTQDMIYVPLQYQGSRVQP